APPSAVREIAGPGSDPSGATRGRAFWGLDATSPLRQRSPSRRAERVHRFAPAPAVRFLGGRSAGPLPTAGENPFPGAAVTYWLQQKPTGDVAITFLDSAGAVIRTYSGKPDSSATVDSATYAPSDSAVPGHAGTNRFAWNLRASDAKKAKDIVVDEGMIEGPIVPPGRYSVKITVAGQSVTQPFTVVNDPRVTTSPADLAAQYAFALQIHDHIDTLVSAVERVQQAESQLASWTDWTKNRPEGARVKAQADSLKRSLEAVRGRLSEPHADALLGSGDTLSGRVADPDGNAVAAATVTVVELHRVALTQADGGYRFTDLPPGRFTITVRAFGFAPVARKVTVHGATTKSVTLSRTSIWVEPVTVTATRAPLAAGLSPLPTEALSEDRLRREQSVSLAQALANLPGINALTTGQQMGKPVIRGLTGPRVLVLEDGSRLEDYSWSDEDGPSVDARLMQRVEVIRGQARVLYGSDALGGVGNVIPEELPDANGA